MSDELPRMMDGYWYVPACGVAGREDTMSECCWQNKIGRCAMEPQYCEKHRLTDAERDLISTALELNAHSGWRIGSGFQLAAAFQAACDSVRAERAPKPRYYVDKQASEWRVLEHGTRLCHAWVLDAAAAKKVCEMLNAAVAK